VASIVVVGAGLAGLTCAWRLQHAGHDVEVFECNDVPGGSLRSEEIDGFRLERGAGALGPIDSNTRVLIRALGLSDLLYPIQPADEGVLRRGRFEVLETASMREFARSRLLSARGKLQLGRLGVELASRRARFDIHHPEFAASLEGGDASFDLRASAGDEARDFVLAPLLEPWLGAALEDTSDAFGRVLLHGLLVGDHSPESLSGGMGVLTDTLAADLSIRCGARVHSIETEEGGARVHYHVGPHRRRVFADAAVVAVPGDDVPALCPKLGPEERGFFEAIRSPRSLVVHALLDEVPRAQPYYRVHLPRPLGFSIRTIGIEHSLRSAAPPGAGLLRLELQGPAAEALWDEEDRCLGDALLDEIERTPIGLVRARRFVVQRNERGAPQIPPGALLRLRGFADRRNRSPRLAFAGSHLVGPYTEGALTSGLRAAADVVRDLD